MKRIKAFTIAELSITLMIGSVVIGIAYYAWLLFTKQQQKQQQRSALIREYFLFNRAVDADINRADHIYDSTGFLVIDAEERAVYDFNQPFIVRGTSSASDTFYITRESQQFFYLNDATNLVNKIAVRFDLGNDHIEAAFKKWYSASQIIHYSPSQFASHE